MAKFRIHTHQRLQEWVAEEKGYFKDEGLDYEFGEMDNYNKYKDVEVAAAAPENACPAGTSGLVGPKPTPNNSIRSPAVAGSVK